MLVKRLLLLYLESITDFNEMSEPFIKIFDINDMTEDYRIIPNIWYEEESLREEVVNIVTDRITREVLERYPKAKEVETVTLLSVDLLISDSLRYNYFRGATTSEDIEMTFILTIKEKRFFLFDKTRTLIVKVGIDTFKGIGLAAEKTRFMGYENIRLRRIKRGGLTK